MKKPTFSLIAAFWVFFFQAPIFLGINIGSKPGNREEPFQVYADTLEPSLIFLAENGEGKAAEKKDEEPDSKGVKTDSESGDEAENGGKPSKPEVKPLKPFAPSEKIKAEQAVDFPVDI